MEFLTRRHRSIRPLPLALMLLAAATCTACGPNIIEGRPPFISISSMSLVDGRLSTEFRIDNQNGIAMNIEAIDLTVAVEDVEIVRENRAQQLSIDANGAEELRVEEQPDDAVRGLLVSLDQRTVNNLPFELTGRVRTLEDGFLRFEQTGHLYPVPGKPGFFRAAVTQAQALRRDDRL